MKKILFFTALLLCNTAIHAEQVYNWGLLWSGSWEDKTTSETLTNRIESTLHYLPLDLLWRGQILSNDSPWSDSEKTATHYTMGLYHKETGSRLLLGLLSEEGLPARIRSPWIRSPPYTDNHTNTSADLRTAVSSTKEDEVYLRLASPFLEITPNMIVKSFFSAQTETDEFTPALSAGLDFRFPKNTRLMAEMFYTEKTLLSKEPTSWFSDPPPLPERDFRLFAAGLIFKNAYFALSSDFAQSEAFAWGSDIYTSLGISITPHLSVTRIAYPLLISFAADGAGPRFVNRDGVNYTESFRSAAKIEWRDRYNSLLKLDTVLRSDAFGYNFNRSSTGIYYRFPANRDKNFVRISTISLSADRNAVNHLKIHDSYSGHLNININMEQFLLKNPLRIYLSGSIKGLSKPDIDPNPYPIPSDWSWESTAISWEFSWTYGIFQLRSKTGCTIYSEKDEKWDFSVSTSARFKHGRLTIKAASPDFPQKWNWSASWRIEINGNS